MVFISTSLATSNKLFTAVIYVYACLSDLGDGYYARKYDATSIGGKALDLFGDKYLTITSIIYAIVRGMPVLPCALIILREVFLLAMRMVYINNKPLFPTQRILGGVTVMIIWSLTFILHLTPYYFPISISSLKIAYWCVGILTLLNLVQKLYGNWNIFIAALREDDKGF